MMEERDIGLKLKEKVKAKGISLRQLSKEVGIDVSTLSRFINNKQKPNIKHLKKLSKALEVPFQELLIEMGYEMPFESNKHTTHLNKFVTESSVDNQDIFNICTSLENEDVRIDIERELDKYGQYIQLPEGKEMVINNFENKLSSVGQIGPMIDLLKKLYNQFSQVDIPLTAMILIGSALIYFIVSPDVIPDFLFPLGFIDDVIAIQMISSKIERNHYV
ncbi:MAG: helix-turn-helix domain-containing protein [Cellulosilyticaceae bacterium]